MCTACWSQSHIASLGGTTKPHLKYTLSSWFESSAPLWVEWVQSRAHTHSHTCRAHTNKARYTRKRISKDLKETCKTIETQYFRKLAHSWTLPRLPRPNRAQLIWGPIATFAKPFRWDSVNVGPELPYIRQALNWQICSTIYNSILHTVYATSVICILCTPGPKLTNMHARSIAKSSKEYAGILNCRVSVAIYIYIYIYRCLYVYIHTHTHINMSVCIYTHPYTYTYIIL